jgi:hypothetical protein
MEIEVITFDRSIARTDKFATALLPTHKRQYLPYFIRDADGNESKDETRHFYKMNAKNEAELAKQEKDNKNEAELAKQEKDNKNEKNEDELTKQEKENRARNQYYLQQFFTKMPTCFRQSSCNGDRLIFRAGTRSTWVYDLKMENGYIRLYSAKERQDKKAFGLQESGMVKDLDFVEENMINIVTEQYEGKWMSATKIDSDSINLPEFRKEHNMKETLLTKLPKILRFPAGFKIEGDISDAILLAIS